MRIIGGSKRGFRILGPPEVEIPDLKPMPDKVREAIFDILGPWVKDKKVLDLYSGTGAVGLEALSRGAESAEFVEILKKTAEVIRENLKKTDFSAEVFERDVLSFLENSSEKFDIIFITPPHEEINFKVAELAGEKLLKNGVIVLESDFRTDIPKIKNLTLSDQRIYGRLKISFLDSVN